MSVDYAILGLLSRYELSGYDLKKIFEESIALYWTGNNNEIYRSLLDLRQRGLVDCQVQPQEKLPARKVYTITQLGREVLAGWSASAPELPQRRHALLLQLAWADALAPGVLDDLLAQYEDELRNHLLITRAQMQPSAPGSRPRFLEPSSARTPRERLLWQSILHNWLAFYQSELDWVQQLRQQLAALPAA